MLCTVACQPHRSIQFCSVGKRLPVHSRRVGLNGNCNMNLGVCSTQSCTPFDMHISWSFAYLEMPASASLSAVFSCSKLRRWLCHFIWYLWTDILILLAKLQLTATQAEAGVLQWQWIGYHIVPGTDPSSISNCQLCAMIQSDIRPIFTHQGRSRWLLFRQQPVSFSYDQSVTFIALPEFVFSGANTM